MNSSVSCLIAWVMERAQNTVIVAIAAPSRAFDRLEEYSVATKISRDRLRHARLVMARHGGLSRRLRLRTSGRREVPCHPRLGAASRGCAGQAWPSPRMTVVVTTQRNRNAH